MLYEQIKCTVTGAEISPNKWSVYSCLKTIRRNLQCSAVLENYLAFKERKKRYVCAKNLVAKRALFRDG